MSVVPRSLRWVDAVTTLVLARNAVVGTVKVTALAVAALVRGAALA